MTYRIIHCGTGNMGRVALRAVLDHPDMELAGLYVSSLDKVGRDAGELLGRRATGILATNEWTELLDLDADCLHYFGNSIGREEDAINDLVPFLERGTNAVTYSGFALAHPATAPPHLRSLIEDACRSGGSSCYFTGIDPGWATTDLAIASLAAANRVDCIRVCELGSFGEYTAEFAMREYFGFGKKPGDQPLLVTGGFIEQMWSPTLHQLADVLGLEIEALEVVYETDSLDHDVETGFGIVAAGTASTIRFELRALNAGRPFAVVEHVDSVTTEPSSRGWRRPHAPVDLAYRIEIEGDSRFSIEMTIESDLNAVMPVVNAVPPVCDAPPGLLAPLDVQRYWSRDAARRTAWSARTRPT